MESNEKQLALPVERNESKERPMDILGGIFHVFTGQSDAGCQGWEGVETFCT